MKKQVIIIIIFIIIIIIIIIITIIVIIIIIIIIIISLFHVDSKTVTFQKSKCTLCTVTNLSQLKKGKTKTKS